MEHKSGLVIYTGIKKEKILIFEKLVIYFKFFLITYTEISVKGGETKLSSFNNMPRVSIMKSINDRFSREREG